MRLNTSQTSANRPPSSATTGNGTPGSVAINDFAGRLERLAFPTAPVAGAGRAPLEAYTVTPTEHGDVVRATDEYVRWFRSRYPKAGGEDRVSRGGASGAPQDVGGKKKAPWMT